MLGSIVWVSIFICLDIIFIIIFFFFAFRATPMAKEVPRLGV